MFPKMSYKRIRRISSFKANNITAKFDVDWDVDKYRDEHESEEHWQLRKSFMERWKNDYPEERLICLARVFCNVELMGCRYPPLVMQEITQLSYEVAKQYREIKKTRLQRTFVSASVAAEDRAKGIKRQGGKIIESEPKRPTINFVRQGHTDHIIGDDDTSPRDNDKSPRDNDFSNVEESFHENADSKNTTTTNIVEVTEEGDKKAAALIRADEYLKETQNIHWLDVSCFNERMFLSEFGRMVLLVRPWARKFENMQSSCQVCGIPLRNNFVDGIYSLEANGKLLAQATGTKVDAKNIAENLAWEKLRKSVINVFIKEQWIAHGDTISLKDVDGEGKRKELFGTPIENSVAIKMMKMMGWKGGGLGTEAQGISEPIKPNLQLVNRAGLGSDRTGNIRALRNSGRLLMQRYIASDTFDVDLVFSSDFNKEERAVLHQCAQRSGLASRSYGEGDDRFLVVKRKLDPFSLVRAIVEKGGITPKYQVYIPAILDQRN